MQYEIINPSDPYTFLAESLEVAALVIFILGGNSYGAKPEDENAEGVPVFVLGGALEWYQKTFQRPLDEAIKVLGLDVANALQSVMLGSFEDRRRYEAALTAIDDPEKRQAFMEKWQDSRSSLNDIGGRSHALARAIRENIEGAT